jgi:type IV secretory pathway VirB2 component (pilin)
MLTSSQLSSVPNDIKRYSLEVADSIDRHVEQIALVIREKLARQSWLPSVIRPPPKVFRASPAPQSVANRIHDWILGHRAWTAAILAFVGTGGLLIFGSKSLNGRKRRARKAVNGARKEIVGMLCQPSPCFNSGS